LAFLEASYKIKNVPFIPFWNYLIMALTSKHNILPKAFGKTWLKLTGTTIYPNQMRATFFI